jgi:glutamine---fructose-6-phosphate transaminase (isomerizing)
MTFMAAEIAETPQVVARLLVRERPLIRDLADRLRGLDPAVIITGARGSSDHAVGYFKYLVEILVGVPVASLGPSVASIYRSPMRLRNAVIVSVSQSGQSPDIVALQDMARTAGAPSIAVVNDAESQLATGAEAVIDIGAGLERSVAATKTCIASAVALAAIVAAWKRDAVLEAALDRLPEALARAAAIRWEAALPVFTSATSAYVLGRGPALPVAAEAALKFKETSALHAEAFSGAEVLHGPLQLLQTDLPVLAFRQEDAASAAMDETVARVVQAGSRVFTASPSASGPQTLPTVATGHWALDPLATLLTFYGFVETVSRARGYDPDRPAQLSKVTRTV